MSIDYEIWNAMSIEEKRAYVEALPDDEEELICEPAGGSSQWEMAVFCSLPAAVGIFAVALTVIFNAP